MRYMNHIEIQRDMTQMAREARELAAKARKLGAENKRLRKALLSELRPRAVGESRLERRVMQRLVAHNEGTKMTMIYMTQERLHLLLVSCGVDTAKADEIVPAATRETAKAELLDHTDAKRWRRFRAMVGATRTAGYGGSAAFTFPTHLGLPPIGDIMRGSVAQHLDASVDALICDREVLGAA